VSKRPNNAALPYYIESRGIWRLAVELPQGPDGRRRRRYVSARSEDEVKRKAKKLRQQLESGLRIPTEFRTVGEFLDWWQAEVLPGSVDESSAETYERAVRLWVKPYVGKVRLIDLQPAHVTKMLRELESRGFPASTRSMARRVLGRALRRAEQEGWVLRNAAHLTDGPRASDDDEMVEEEDDSPILTVDQAKAFLGAAQGHRYEGPMVVQLSLGMRRGEAPGSGFPGTSWSWTTTART
jgi:hypothetical protein